MTALLFPRVARLFLFLAVALATSPVAADGPDPLLDDYRRAESLVQQFEQHLSEGERHYQAVVLPLRGGAGPTGKEPRFLAKARQEAQRLRGLLAEARTGYDSRKLGLGPAAQACARIGAGALGAAFQLSLDLAGAHVDALAERQRLRALEGTREHAEKQAGIDARSGEAKARAAASAELRQASVQREQADIEALRRDYQAVQTRLLAERRRLCGEQWKLADFQNKRGRPALAREALRQVYSMFELRPSDRGAEFCRRVFDSPRAPDSSVDFFLIFPGSPDRLIVIAYFAKVTDSPWKMDAAFRAEPVESLRQFDGLAPLTATGSQLEQNVRFLAQRILALNQARRRLAEQFAALENAGRTPMPPADLGDLPAVRTELLRMAEARRDFATITARFQQARQGVERAEAAVANAERDERAAREAVRLHPRTLRPTAVGDQTGDAAGRLLAEANRQLRAADELARTLDPQSEQFKAMQAQTLPRLRERVGAVQQAIDTAVSAQDRQLAEARKRRDQARADLTAVPDPGPAERWRTEWSALAARHERLAGQARAAGLTLPPFPPEPEGEAVRRLATSLTELATRLAAQRTERELGLGVTLGELRQADHDVRLLAASVASLRASGAVLAEQTLSELGAKATDSVLAELGRLKEAAEETKKFFESYDGQLEQAGKFLEKMGVKAKARGWITRTRGYVGTIQKTFGKTSELVESGLKLQEIYDQLGDDRTVLQGIAGIIDLTKGTAKTVPVAGGLLADALGYYADVARAAGEAAVRIQSSLIEQDLAVSFSQPPPERRLYVEDDLAALRVGNAPARARVLRMLQVRRLLALLGSEEDAIATEMRR